MCRLLCVKSENEFDISNHLNKFAATAKNSKEYQGHGWGCAYLQQGAWNIYRNIEPIWEDNFQRFAKTKLLLAHARSAFKNKDIMVENNMPFYDGKYVFIFNGELHGVRINETGRIGAEKVFNFIRRFDMSNMQTALQRGLEQIEKRTKYIRAANIIIADKNNVYWASRFNEDPDYFTMYHIKRDGQQIIGSESYIGEDDWEKIAQGSNGVL